MRTDRIFSRRTLSKKMREEAAKIASLRDHPRHINNGEEAIYRNPSNAPKFKNELNYIANYTKGLPHQRNGEVDPRAYRALLRALDSGEQDDFERIPLGRPAPVSDIDPNRLRFTNPQAGLAFDLEGPDAQSLTMPPAPRIDEPEAAGEMVELYWIALLRDFPFVDFEDNARNNDVRTASDELSGLSDFRGPKIWDRNTRRQLVTPSTIFRGSSPGDLVGPFVSQFLLKGNDDMSLVPDERERLIKYGSIFIDQKQKTVVAGTDYLTDYNTWLAVQNGLDTSAKDRFDNTGRYFIRNMRDLANYVHFDALYEAYLNACLYLLSLKVPNPNPGLPAPPHPEILFDPGNPYRDSITQLGFGTLGAPNILSLVTEAATRALKVVWFQKWFVHRRLRPEEFGARVHNEIINRANNTIPRYAFISDELINSEAVRRVHRSFRSYLLPQAFPEGCPTHPSYGSGHATIAGTCVTILKAWFDESFILSNPVESTRDGNHVQPYRGPDRDSLTVGGELNKLASNIAIARNMAGVHYRSDYAQSIRLGEAIGVSILEEQKQTYNEDFSFRLTKFDGTAIII